MHEFSLYGTVTQHEYERVRQQLAGVARMQPQDVKEIHLVFRAKQPSGLANLPSAGGSQGVMQQDMQRIKTMLNASLYYVHLVGTLPEGFTQPNGPANGNLEMTNGDSSGVAKDIEARWTLEFKDTPDPGKQSVSSRLISRVVIGDGDAIKFMDQFGYEYMSRYLISGSKFYDQDTTLYLHELLQLPQVEQASEAVRIANLPAISQLQPVDPGRKHLLQVLVEVVDGNHPDLKERATGQLLMMRDTLKQAVKLGLGDRLALDTKVPTAPRRL